MFELKYYKINVTFIVIFSHKSVKKLKWEISKFILNLESIFSQKFGREGGISPKASNIPGGAKPSGLFT